MSQNDNEIFFTLADVKYLLLKHIKNICKIGLIVFCTIFIALLFVSSPKYEAEAFFNQVPDKFEEKISVTGLLLGGQNNVSSALSLMKTPCFMRYVVEKDGMNFFYSRSSTTKIFERVYDNVRVLLKKPLQEREDFEFKDTFSAQEFGSFFYLRFIEENRFEIFDNLNHLLTKGQIGEPVVLPKLRFTLTSQPSFVKKNKSYKIIVDFWFNTANSLTSGVTIVPQKSNVNLLKLTYCNRNRNRAISILDSVMNQYVLYLKRENEDFRKNQFLYLEKKQQELSLSFERSLDEYVAYVNDSIKKKGFINLGHESISLLEPQQKYLSDLFALDLKKSAVDKALIDPNYSLVMKDKKMSDLTKSIADLQQRKDILDISLQKEDKKNVNTNLTKMNTLHQQLEQVNFNLEKLESRDFSFDNLDNHLKDLKIRADHYLQQKNELENNFKKIERAEVIKERINTLSEVRIIRQNVESIYNTVSQEGRIPTMLDLAFDKEGIVKLWLDNLREKKDLCQFLERYIHSLKLKEKSLEEGNFYLEKMPQEFSSLEITTAQKIVDECGVKMNDLELKIRQLSSILLAMKDNNFEMSSLNIWFEDNVSLDFLQKASKLQYQENDRRNFTDKDRKANFNELIVIKSFFAKRIEELSSLSKIEKELLEEKIFFLKEVMLDRLNQKISLLKEETQNYLVSLKKNLEGEKILLENKLKELQDKMIDIPERWRKEKLLNLKAEMNLAMVKTITEMIENKNIGHNLSQVGSKPFGSAIAPLQSKESKVIIYSFILAFLSSAGYFTYQLFKRLLYGFSVSLEYLQMLGYNVCGSLKQDFLRTMRNIVSRIKEKVVVIYRRGDINYVEDLISLLRYRGEKILVIESAKDGQDDSFLRFCKKEIKQLPIVKEENIEKLFLTKDNFNNIINSRTFKEVLLSLQDKYDYIFIVADINQAWEAEEYLGIAKQAVFILQDDTTHELQLFFNWAKDKEKLIFAKG